MLAKLNISLFPRLFREGRAKSRFANPYFFLCKILNMKETFYFSHDYNSRDDEKILELRMDYGWEWYWIYWALIEKLASNKWKLSLETFKWLIYDLRVEQELLKHIIFDYNLFIIDEENWVFYNKRLLEHFEKRDKIKEVRSAAWKRWWRMRQINNKQMLSKWLTKSNKGKETKGKENKEKESKVNILEEWFERFWEKYPKKTDKKTTERRFMSLSIKSLDNVFVWLDLYLNKWIKEWTKRQYIPNPSTWLNREMWTDEVVIWDLLDKVDLEKREKIKQKTRDNDKVEAKDKAEAIRIKNQIESIINKLPTEKQKHLDEIILANVLKLKPGMKWKENTAFIKPLLLAEKHRFIREKYKIK